MSKSGDNQKHQKRGYVKTMLNIFYSYPSVKFFHRRSKWYIFSVHKRSHRCVFYHVLFASLSLPTKKKPQLNNILMPKWKRCVLRRSFFPASTALFCRRGDISEQAAKITKRRRPTQRSHLLKALPKAEALTTGFFFVLPVSRGPTSSHRPPL